MSVYYGFFDAKFEESTASYDREYDSADFTHYFGEIIGSGVCIHDNPDSMKVSVRDGSAVIAPGYLFIDGYWLKNDADYVASLPADGVYAVLAQLDLGNRMIRIDVQPKREDAFYPDALVLAFADAQGNVEDTRHDTALCGVIDSAGSLATKIEFAIQYIDTEIEGRLEQAEAQINAKTAELDTKIAEVDAQVAKLAPPAVGTIKFSASQDVGDDWLVCNGSYVSEQDYPELVAALGKLIPSQDRFSLIEYTGEIPSIGISNSVLYEGYLWVYCLGNHTLYGIPVEGGVLKEIPMDSDDPNFNNLLTPSLEYPIALSIIRDKLSEGSSIFIAQIIREENIQGTPDKDISVEQEAWLKNCPVFGGIFNKDAASINLSSVVDTIPDGEKDSSWSGGPYYKYTTSSKSAVPYVISKIENAKEVYYCLIGVAHSTHDTGIPQTGTFRALKWTKDKEIVTIISAPTAMQNVLFDRTGYSEKNHDECLVVKKTNIYSSPTGEFNTTVSSQQSFYEFKSLGSMSIASPDKSIAQYDIHNMNFVSKVSSTSKKVSINITSVPPMAKVFLDAAQYLWEKDIFLFFIGTGIMFSRTLIDDFGYLDTTGVLGIITQYGDLRYDGSEGIVYIVGQDSTNKVKAAKIKLDTLYNFANDGAWLPLIASDGVPAYIKARETEG